MKKPIFLIITMLFCLNLAISAQDEEIPVRNIVYADANPRRQRLDVYLPEELNAPAPTIVILHGGRGNKAEHVAWATHLVEQGYAVILPNYRIQPAQHTDGFCAVAWAHTHTEDYLFDTNHLFVMGWSSGGGIAAEIGTIDAGVDPFEEDECAYPIPETWVTGTILLAAGSERWAESGWRTDMEPLIWLDGSESPFLLIHGTRDAIIPVEDSEQMAAALEEMGVSVELLILPQANHFFPLPGDAGNGEAWQAVDDFLAEQINLESDND
jgi:acetyl esterase/lipase